MLRYICIYVQVGFDFSMNGVQLCVLFSLYLKRKYVHVGCYLFMHGVSFGALCTYFCKENMFMLGVISILMVCHLREKNEWRLIMSATLGA